MSEIKAPVFECPACNAPVEGKADYIARGLKCPACGVGFAPVHVETRWPRDGARKGPMFPYWAWALVFVVFLIAVGLVNFWVAAALTGLGLLAGIFMRLGKRPG